MLSDSKYMFCSCPIGQILHIKTHSSKRHRNTCATLQQQTPCRKQAKQKTGQTQIQYFPINTGSLFC